MRRMRALILATVLTLSTAGIAAADTISESFTVNTALTLAGIPASINYGAVTPGTPSAAQSFTMTVGANVAWRVDTTGSAFVRSTGGAITGAFRQVQFVDLVGMSTNAPSWTPYSLETPPDQREPSTDAELYGAAGTGMTADTELRLNLAADVLPGNYTGTVTFTIGAS